jgi:acetyl esterase/lipase
MKPLWNLPPKFISTTHSLGRFLRRDVVGMTPVQVRVALDSLSLLYPGPADVHFAYEERSGMQMARLKPKYIQPKTGVLFVHGGGFAFGSARTHRALASAITKETGCEVWLPEYPLAPESPYPSALDALDLLWADFEAQFDVTYVLADSAGGNLAVALMQRLQPAQLDSIEGLILLSPWLDLRPGSMSSRTNSKSWSPFDRLDMLEYVTHYLAGANPNQPSISPILGVFSGFPKTLIETSKMEYLYPDACELKEKLTSNAIQVAWRVEENALHAWQLFPDILPEAKRSVRAISEFMTSKPVE